MKTKSDITLEDLQDQLLLLQWQALRLVAQSSDPVSQYEVESMLTQIEDLKRQFSELED